MCEKKKRLECVTSKIGRDTFVLCHWLMQTWGYNTDASLLRIIILYPKSQICLVGKKNKKKNKLLEGCKRLDRRPCSNTRCSCSSGNVMRSCLLESTGTLSWNSKFILLVKFIFCMTSFKQALEGRIFKIEEQKQEFNLSKKFLGFFLW